VSEDHEDIPTRSGSHDGEPLYDLGGGVYAEWWQVGDQENWGIVEHHWCVSDVEIIPGVKEFWSMGSVPVEQSNGTTWSIQQGERGSFEHLTLAPSVLCKRCSLHGWIRDGRWVPA
jgi:hypothetical protein